EGKQHGQDEVAKPETSLEKTATDAHRQDLRFHCTAHYLVVRLHAPRFLYLYTIDRDRLSGRLLVRHSIPSSGIRIRRGRQPWNESGRRPVAASAPSRHTREAFFLRPPYSPRPRSPCMMPSWPRLHGLL